MVCKIREFPAIGAAVVLGLFRQISRTKAVPTAAGGLERKQVSMPEKRHQGLRKFNRTFFNPVIKLFAGRFFYALVYHVGRRSGKAYTTPVVAVRADGSIFIPLPYGADTDWLLNVQARAECRVKMNGRLYAAAGRHN